MQVTVLEGRVEIVDDKPPPRATTASSLPAPPLRLAAGEQVRLTDRSVQPPRIVRVDAKRATSWASREISFAGARLEDVLAQFTRYTGAHIAIDNDALRDYRVSGIFQAWDLDSFVAYLEQLDGVTVEREGTRILVRSDTPDAKD
jgi:transmembrane sensor